MFFIAPTVNMLCQNLREHATLSWPICSMAAFHKFVDIFNNQSLLISPRSHRLSTKFNFRVLE